MAVSMLLAAYEACIIPVILGKEKATDLSIGLWAICVSYGGVELDHQILELLKWLIT